MRGPAEAGERSARGDQPPSPKRGLRDPLASGGIGSRGRASPGPEQGSGSGRLGRGGGLRGGRSGSHRVGSEAGDARLAGAVTSGGEARGGIGLGTNRANRGRCQATYSEVREERSASAEAREAASVPNGGGEAGKMAFSLVSETGYIGEGEKGYDYPVEYPPVSQPIS